MKACTECQNLFKVKELVRIDLNSDPKVGIETLCELCAFNSYGVSYENFEEARIQNKIIDYV